MTMTSIHPQRPWTRQPQYAARIHDGLSASPVYVINPALGILEARRALTLSSGSGATREVNTQGRVIRTAASQSSVYYEGLPIKPTAATLLWVGEFLGAASTFAAIGGISHNSVNNPPYESIKLKRNYSGNNLALDWGEGTTPRSLASAGSGYVTGYFVLVGVVEDGRQELYVNGLKSSSSLSATIPYNATSSQLTVGDALNARNPNAACALMVVFDGALTEPECRLLSVNPWAIYRDTSRRVFVDVSSSGTDLILEDALHAHAADALTLTQLHLLTVADAAHAHLADALTLTQTHILALADALHAHAVDNVVLTQTHLLAVADALHAHLAEELSLDGATVLAIADALHAHLADGVALTQLHVLTVSDALHAHLADALTLAVPGAALLHDRVLLVRGENRTLVILAENRTLEVSAENRTLTVH